MQRWQVIVELTSDIKPDESPMQGLMRVKDALDPVLGDTIKHYHILQKPKIVEEFD
jgi:hypothetical protein